MKMNRTNIVIQGAGSGEIKKASRFSGVGIILISIIIPAVIFVAIQIVQRLNHAQAKSREIKTRFQMAAIQAAMEKFCDDNDARYAGGFEVTNLIGKKLRDYIETDLEGTYTKESPVVDFKASGQHGILDRPPSSVASSKIWIYTDALSIQTCDATMYNIFGRGRNGQLIETGMLSREINIARN